MNDGQLDALADVLVDKLAARLPDTLVDQVTERLLERTNGAPAETLIDAIEVARRYGVERAWVYSHADELGAIRLGDGSKPRLRFDPKLVHDGLAARPSPVTTRPIRPRPSRRGSSVELLPIKGDH